MKKALIAMSGGVDSSVAAYLMKDNGYDCIGVNLTMFDKTRSVFAFPKEKQTDDVKDAELVCKRVGIPFEAIDASESFEKYVISNFIKTYEDGETPNPCIECNRNVKFKVICDIAEAIGFDVVATGHYANIDNINGRYALKRAADCGKDQSYVLSSLTQQQLGMVMFPLGNLTKDRIREIAEEHGFINAHKRDSQDICFIPDGDYIRFITEYTGKTYPHGNFIDVNGNVLGEHLGMVNYTIGQRRGLRIALGYHAYVKEKNAENNTVVLAANDELYSSEVTANNFNFISEAAIQEPLKCTAKVRYSHNEQSAVAFQLDANTVRVKFDKPQRAAAKGQTLVIYNGDYVVGGGKIL